MPYGPHTEGDRVIVYGLQGGRPGAQVLVSEAGAAPAAAAVAAPPAAAQKN